MNPGAEFFAAIEAGDLSRAQSLLATDPSLAHAWNQQGATALHVAAFHGYKQIVNLLCKAGADLNARDRAFGATPAGWALHYLRERGAFLAIEIDDLLHAVTSRDVEWTRRLVQRHPQIVHAKDSNDRPLSEYARNSGVAAIAEMFSSPSADN